MTLRFSHTKVFIDLGQKQLWERAVRSSVRKKLMGLPNYYKSTWYGVFYQQKIETVLFLSFRYYYFGFLPLHPTFVF